MEKKGIRDYYNKTASQWADTFYANDETLPTLTDFMSRLSKGSRVLDLCCGTGYDSMRLSQMGASVVGLDLSEVSIAIAKKRNPDIPFYVGDMLVDYRIIGPVDAIVCCAGLVHLPNEKLRTAFTRMHEVMKPNGSLLLVVRDGTGRIDHLSDLVVDGETYDRAFYAHNLAELEEHAEGLFAYERTIEEPEASVWVNYVFKRM